MVRTNIEDINPLTLTGEGTGVKSGVGMLTILWSVGFHVNSWWGMVEWNMVLTQWHVFSQTSDENLLP